jgi:hypothetical protein
LKCSYLKKRRGFTKDSTKAIPLTVFGISLPNSGPTSSETEWLKILEELDIANPGKIDGHVAESETAAAAPTNGHSNNAFGLHGKWFLSKVLMNTDLSPLAIALKVLQVINMIEAIIKISGSADDDNDTDRESEYA